MEMSRIKAPLGLALMMLLTLVPTVARAQVVSGSVTVSPCLTLTGQEGTCTDTGFLDLSAAGASSQFIGAPVVAGSTTPATFASAFNAWNAANGGAWTLVDGGTLNDLSINAFVGVSASPDSYTAGLGPVIFSLSGNDPNLDSLVWTQALVINYTPLLGPLANPIETLDTFSLSQDPAGDNPYFPTSCSSFSPGAGSLSATFCDPIYPFQYGASLNGYGYPYGDAVIPFGVDPFYDAPAGLWPNASFEAVTLLSEISETPSGGPELIVYQGERYGFQLTAVPEPSTWALLALGFAGLGMTGRRGSRRVAKSIAA